MDKKSLIKLAAMTAALIGVFAIINYLQPMETAATKAAASAQTVVNGQTLNVTVTAPDSGFNWNSLIWLGLGGAMLYVMVTNNRRQMRALTASTQTDALNKMNKHLAKRGDLIAKRTFDDLGGVGPAKAELMEIVDMLRNPERYTRLGGRIPAGVLMKGPPGTGKSALAEATAQAAGRPFFALTGSDFVEKLVGVGASRIRDLFDEARRNAPCIIFIDEIEVLGKRRESTENGQESGNTLNQLLSCMDGLGNNENGIVLIGATNNDEAMDPALLRPGRLDRHVTVTLPDRQGRLEILAIHARKKPLDPAISLEQIADRTYEMSGAHLMTILNEAALAAARRNDDTIRPSDVFTAIDKVSMGTELAIVPSQEEKLNTSRHEVGHAIVLHRLPHTPAVTKVSILPRSRALGVTLFSHGRDKYQTTRQEYLDLLAGIMGGRAAEIIEYGLDGTTSGASNDLKVATEMCRDIITKWGFTSVGLAVTSKNSLGQYECSPAKERLIELECEAMMELALSRAKETILANRADFDRMVEALMEKETLQADDVVAMWGTKNKS